MTPEDARAAFAGAAASALSAEFRPSPSGDGAASLHTTDLGNAERFAVRHGARVRYVRLLDQWFVYDGKRWAEDSTGEVVRMAVETVRSIYGAASSVEDSAVRGALGKHAAKSEAEPRIRAMLKLAQSLSPIAARPEQFDADPYLLNCGNGTLDLRTGQVREHKPDDYCTNLAPVAYDANAKCPRFLAFLDRIMDGNEELVGYLRRALGSALSGKIQEHVLFVLYGLGDNGKTTLVEVFRDMLGGYSRQAEASTLLRRRSDGPRDDVARLPGARFVTAVEPEANRHLAEGIVKQLTGGDTIAARPLYGKLFEFRPTFKLFLVTNHKPLVQGTDHAIWRRIRLVPFLVKVPEAEQDKSLRDKLRDELPGILGWAVAGCMEWQVKGLGDPPEVQEATQQYRVEQDLVGNFLGECCVLSPDTRAGATDLFRSFERWCGESGAERTSQKDFGGRLAERGYKSRKVNGRMVWPGIGLRDDGRVQG